MTYNPQKSKEIENENKLPADLILDAAIVNITDGQVNDFLSENAKKKWEGDITSQAINLTIETIYEGNNHSFNVMFTYKDENGTTTYGSKSNLAKYVKKYGKLPEPKDKVKVITDSEGWLKLKLY